MLLLSQRVKSNSDQGFALLSFGEEPCPLSLSHGFFTIQPSPGEGSPRSGPASMFERSELRSRREERMENGVKNLKGSEAISQNLLVAF